MRLRRSRKIWRVHEGHDFEASSQFKPPNASKLNTPNFTGSPNQFAAREITTIKFQQVIPISNKVHDPQSASARPMSRARLIAGISTRGKFPMEGPQVSQVRAELARLFDERIKFFSKTYSTAAEGYRNCANNKKDRSAYGSDLGNYADCEKWQRQKLDGVRR